MGLRCVNTHSQPHNNCYAELGNERSLPVTASPAQIDGKALTRTGAPQHGEYTEVVLME